MVQESETVQLGGRGDDQIHGACASVLTLAG
jgi:hypothetical protein